MCTGGTVASTDFWKCTAISGKGDGGAAAKGSIATGGFGAEQVVRGGGPKIAQPDASAANTPVNIMFKPSPVYTDEARGLKLEGEVLLDVSFSANGSPDVNCKIRFRPYVLDEAAVVAAVNKIRFAGAKAITGSRSIWNATIT